MPDSPQQSNVLPSFAAEALEPFGVFMAKQSRLVGLVMAEAGMNPCPAGVEPFRVPIAFLMEVGAAVQVVQWRLNGLVEYGGLDLPTMQDAALAVSQAAALLVKGYNQELRVSPLVSAVLSAWLERFAWCGSTSIDANVVMTELDEDTCVEIMAQLILSVRGNV